MPMVWPRLVQHICNYSKHRLQRLRWEKALETGCQQYKCIGWQLGVLALQNNDWDGARNLPTR